jgi:hypothetical protein
MGLKFFENLVKKLQKIIDNIFYWGIISDKKCMFLNYKEGIENERNAIIFLAILSTIMFFSCDDIMNRANRESTPEEHQGTWKKGNVTLVIEASQLTISGANWSDINKTFQIESINQNNDTTHYYFPPYRIDCKLVDENLVILPGSGPGELHGTWTLLME